MIQILTAHGQFKSYLFNFKRAPSPFCDFCYDHSETPEHFLFFCKKIEKIRVKLFNYCNKYVKQWPPPLHLITMDPNLWFLANSYVLDTRYDENAMEKIWKKYKSIANISVANCAKNGWIKNIGRDRAFGVLHI